MGDIGLSLSLPLDSDRFLRRECPHCERELKWRVASEGETPTPPPEGGYYCVYCGEQASVDAWWTPAQLEAAEAQVYREVLKPELEELAESARTSSSDFVSIDVGGSEPEEPEPLSETDDMRRVDFGCHPHEPVKVLDDWKGPVHCPLCGSPDRLTDSSA